MDFSREFGLRADIVEKDYVLDWLLAGISNQKELASAWVFKGGTCLKKCFFETYRFSEDLDFTIIDPGYPDGEFPANVFKEIAGWVYEKTGIELPRDLIRFEVYTNPRGKLSTEGRVSYRGPLQISSQRDLPRVKLETWPMTRFWCSNQTTVRFTTPIQTDQKMVSMFNVIASRNFLQKRLEHWQNV